MVTAEAQAATCESLLTLSLPHTTVTLAQPVAAGAFSLSPSRRGACNLPPPSNSCRRFAASLPLRRPPATPRSGSKCGCRSQAGTASSKGFATAGTRERLPMPPGAWPRARDGRGAETGVCDGVHRHRAHRRDRVDVSSTAGEIGTDGKLSRTRPLCPYPQVAKHNGTGSLDEAANCRCVLP